MLDVHAPEHRIGGFKDFLIHLLTITIGLLIALGLENAAEAFHHRHQRKEAEVQIRQEIQDNRQSLKQGEVGLKDEIAGMTSVLGKLESIHDGQQIKLGEKDLEFREGPMQDAAWRTANSTGALSYMDYSEVEGFSQAYKEQDELQGMEGQAVNDYLQLVPILRSSGGVIDAERAKVALPFARSAMGHLSGMYFIGEGTLGAYDAALK